MRSYEFVIAVIVLYAAIVFVGAMDDDYGIFGGEKYIVEPQISDEFRGWDIEKFNETIVEDKSLYKGTGLFATYEAIKRGFEFAIGVVKSVVYIYPVLIHVFGIPSIMSAFIQVMFYVVCIWGALQFLSGRSSKHMT